MTRCQTCIAVRLRGFFRWPGLIIGGCRCIVRVVSLMFNVIVIAVAVVFACLNHHSAKIEWSLRSLRHSHAVIAMLSN